MECLTENMADPRTHRMRSKAYTFMSLLMICSAVFLVGCKENKTPLSAEMLEINAKIAADKAHEEARKPHPPIDPSICKDNPEGYLYFQVGEEIFRYTKDSPIQVASVPSIAQRGLNEEVMRTDIPEGCEGNPYRKVPLDFNFKEGEKLIGEFRLGGFGLGGITPEYYGKISPGQDLLEARFNQVKSTYGTCDVELKNLTRCIIVDEDVRYLNGRRSTFYMADEARYPTEFDQSFIFVCERYVIDILCKSYYRLYPTVDLSYKLFPSSLDEKGILLFDQYLRGLIENMRVKNRSKFSVSSNQPVHE